MGKYINEAKTSGTRHSSFSVKIVWVGQIVTLVWIIQISLSDHVLQDDHFLIYSLHIFLDLMKER